MISNKLVIIIKAQSSKAFIQKGKRNIKQYTENQIEEHLNDFYMIIVDEKR